MHSTISKSLAFIASVLMTSSNRCIVAAMLIGLSVFAEPVAAELFNRGRGLIYDSSQNVTWLQNANYIPNTGFDPDGRVPLASALQWVESLNTGGYDDWRLPRNSGQIHTGQLYGPNGELGNLFYSLGNVAGGSFSNVGPFLDIRAEYWLATVPAAPPLPFGSYAFATEGGYEYASGSANQVSVWPVRDGDVEAVPEAATRILMVFAIAAFPISRRRRFH